MHKTATKFLLVFICLTVFAVAFAFAQATITIGTIDPGPYGPGSTIAIPFHIDDSGGCLSQNNTFQLYMTNKSGVKTSPETMVGTPITGFYATFFNYTLPSNIAAGNNYQFYIKATNGGSTITSNNSTTLGFNVVSTPGIDAATTSTAINSNYSTFDNIIFGQCGNPSTPYFFTNKSGTKTGTTATSTTVSFYNELSQTTEATQDITNSGYNFTTAHANYTVTVKSTNAVGIVGTRSYQLINNDINTTIRTQGNSSVCIDNGGHATLSYFIDPTAIKNNYPGNTYTFVWGDGAVSTYTYCQILALGGNLSHDYTQPSCSNTANGHINSYEVDFSATNPYCGRVGTATSSYAQIIIHPTNIIFNPPTSACTNTNVTFVNHSLTGPDPFATTSSCNENPNAQYTWLVDNVIVDQNDPVSTNFVYKFTNPGIHQVTLHAQTSNGACTATDVTINICIQDPPKPIFTLPASPYCLSNGPVIPVNTSVIDPGCSANPVQTWTVTPSTGVTFINGTTKNSPTPQISFANPGVYTIKLAIATASCGTVTATSLPFTVDTPPVATLSPDFSQCGIGTLTFNATAGATKTTLTGSTQGTYLWTVTGDPGFSFVNGTSATSQFPQIKFTDFATYTITVTNTNSCGPITSAPQNITFLPTPTITTSAAQTTICQGNIAQLTGTVTGGTVTNPQWTSSSGAPASAFSNPGSLITDYTPTATDIRNGTVTLNLQVQTTLPPPCNIIVSTITITIIPTNLVTSAATKTICSGTPVNYTITASNTGSTFAWVAALTSGSATGFTASGTGSTITDAITSTDPATDAIITYTITPTSGTCPGTSFTFTVTIPAIPVVTTTAANASICSGSAAGISLASTQMGTKYTWTVNSPAGVTGATTVTTATASTTINDILKNTGTTNATVTYTIIPYNTAGCAGTPVPISITVYPQPVTANAGADMSICDATTYTLQGNQPAYGTGLWTVVNGTGVTFTDATQAGTTVTGLLPGNVYDFKWTIATGAGCQTFDDVIITVDIPTVGGTTASTDPTTVCAGSNSGAINLSGQTGRILRWEQSTNNGVTWQPTATNITATFLYQNLTQTTQIRAVVQNGSCLAMASTPTIITVNATAPVANAGVSQTLCGATTTTLNGNNPGTFAGVWRQVNGPAITFADSTKYNTAITGLVGGNTYTFVWSVASLAPCPTTSSQMQVIDNADIVPSFTSSTNAGCGNLSVQFTNTSNNQTGATFVWTFGDGSAQTNAVSPSHIFPQRLDGRDTTYHVTLSVLNSCAPHPPAADTVRVRPAVPIARILPTSLSGCGNFAIDIQNISPGTNVSYDFYLYDGSTLVQKITKLDKSDAVFNAIAVTSRKTYIIYMIATGYCNTTDETAHIPITISPTNVVAQMFVQGNINRGCAPLALTFINNSSSGDNFVYNIYDSNKKIIDQPIGGTDPLPYVFNSVGTFYVSITGSNACGSNESPLIRIDVFSVPTPNFVADTTTACKDLLVTFTNTTVSNDPNLPASSLNYDWDFGDGSTHSASFTPPPHSYHFTNSPFTVTLTAINSASNCSNVIIKRSYIVITGPPATDFIEKPDSVTVIPNYTFNFSDETTNAPVSWKWKTSDGQTSTQRNPTITFPDTGTYKVTLLTANAGGCDSATTHSVRINGVPGQLYLPNAFIPTSLTSDLKVFMAKGSGIKTWHLQIFNKYGQLVWETDKLSNKGEPIDGWDGTFNGVPAPQGVYVWQASATFINGSEWKGNTYNKSAPKRTGSVHLIR